MTQTRRPRWLKYLRLFLVLVTSYVLTLLVIITVMGRLR